MKIGGLEKLTLIDFPGEVAAIVFTQGCNFRCQFCYNPMLVWPMNKDSKLQYENPSIDGAGKDHFSISEDDLFAFLESRVNRLDGVVITGGEPTLHGDLPEFIDRIRMLGLKVKLDTNGTNPKMVKELIDAGKLDYIAMDVKAPLARYEEVVGVNIPAATILESIRTIRNNGRVPYEFRTTVVPGLVGEEDIAAMGEMIKGADRWFLQNFKSDTDLVNGKLRGGRAYSPAELERVRTIGDRYVRECEIR